MPRSIIIDTDPSPDDAVAILVALASPEELEVLAVTTGRRQCSPAAHFEERAHSFGVGTTNRNARVCRRFGPTDSTLDNG